MPSLIGIVPSSSVARCTYPYRIRTFSLPEIPKAEIVLESMHYHCLKNQNKPKLETLKPFDTNCGVIQSCTFQFVKDIAHTFN